MAWVSAAGVCIFRVTVKHRLRKCSPARAAADALGFSDFQAFLQGGDAVEGFGCADVGELVRDGF